VQTKINDTAAALLFPFACDPDGYLFDGNMVSDRDMPPVTAEILVRHGLVTIVDDGRGYAGVRLTALGQAFFAEVAAEEV